MRRRGYGVALFMLSSSCGALVVGCGGSLRTSLPVTPPLASRSPSVSAPSADVTTAPIEHSPLRTNVQPRPDALGARRVIPVPKAIAQTQIHRLMAVDGQTVLLDAGSDMRQRPLLVVLHGLGEDALEMRGQTGFTALAALGGFDVVYPNAPQDPAVPPASGLVATTAQLSVVVRSTPAPLAATASPSPSPSASESPSTQPGSPTPSVTPSHRPSPAPTRTVTPTPRRTVTVVPTTRASRPTPPPPLSKKKTRPSPLVSGTRAWNAGSCCAVATRNDVGYLVDVVHAVASLVRVDASRVYIVGFSNGGMMALDAICSAPNVFAAAGSVSGPFLGKTCARPIWRHIAAAQDEVVPPAGGVSPGVPGLGVVRDWCGCTFPATTSETARFGFFASVMVSPTGGHSWPTPTGTGWAFDPERDLWNYVSRFHF